MSTEDNLQSNVLIRLSFAFLATMFVIMIGLIWQTTASTQSAIREMDRLKIIMESHEKDLAHLRGHADSIEQSLRTLAAQQNDLTRRLSELEGTTLNTQPVFTKQDGNALIGVVQVISFRLDKLEEKMQLIVDRAMQRIEDADIKSDQRRKK
jgi:hypothetical protein